MENSVLLTALRRQVEKTVACTDVGSISLAVAISCALLGESPHRLEVRISPSLLKNAANVGIVGFEKRGADAAAAVGAFLADHSEKGLEILRCTDRDSLNKARALLEEGRVEIICQTGLPAAALYIKAVAVGAEQAAYAVIAGHYSQVVETGRGTGGDIPAMALVEPEPAVLSLHPLEEVVQCALRLPQEELEFLVEAAACNRRASLSALEAEETILAKRLYRETGSTRFPYNAMEQARFYTGAASEARMIGLPVPIVSLVGSGNHGIANFLGVLAVAGALQTPSHAYRQALALSTAITIYIKEHIHLITNICGCSIAASAGVAAATVWLLGGGYAQMADAMDMVIGTLLGMLCDGAKETCAYKISTVVSCAIEYGYFATKGVAVPKSTGVVGATIEGTIRNLGRVNNQGMEQTGHCVLEIIQEGVKSRIKNGR